MSYKSSSKLIAGALIAGLLLQMPTAFAAKDTFDQTEIADNLSQLIRSNAPHYWTFVKQNDLGPLKPFTEFEGFVAGDPHLGNFSVIPVVLESGRREMRFLNIDFDDAGVAPFALDFARLVIASEAINGQIKKRTLEDAYLKGLQGKKMQVPDSIRDYLDTKISDYDEQLDKYVDKKLEGDQFERKAGKIERYDGPVTRGSIEKLFPDMKVLDIARRPKERGGSAEGMRIWVLVEKANGQKRIMELKKMMRSGASYYRSQPSTEEWIEGVREAFWPGIDKSNYDLVKLGDAGYYWVREKREALIDIPYSSKKAEKIDFLKDLAAYDAYQLGLAHGRQEQGPAYLEAIEADTNAFHKAIEPLVRSYLTAADDAFAGRQ